jgi:hypothetical protein
LIWWSVCVVVIVVSTVVSTVVSVIIVVCVWGAAVLTDRRSIDTTCLYFSCTAGDGDVTAAAVGGVGVEIAGANVAVSFQTDRTCLRTRQVASCQVVG